GKYRNANKIGVTVTNDQNGGEAGQMYATLKSVDGKLTETTGTAPTEGQVSVFTKSLDGSDVQLVEGTEVALGTLAGDDTQDLDFDIFLPADVIDQANKDGVDGFKSEAYNFVVTYI